MRRSATLAACAALVTCVACGRNTDTAADDARKQGDRSTSNMSSTREAGGVKNQAVTLEGCLQQGTGALSQGYLLTMVNSPSTAGTAGRIAATDSAVEREQLRATASTYRLDTKDDLKLATMVGKRIRVSGTMAEPATAPNGRGATGSDRDTQVQNRDTNTQRNRETRLDATDLGRVDVSSASVVSGGCDAPHP